MADSKEKLFSDFPAPVSTRNVDGKDYSRPGKALILKRNWFEGFKVKPPSEDFLKKQKGCLTVFI